jgi:hypothetical protein
MKGKVTCTCGWSWNKSDSSKKDMYICHECGRDNSNNIPKAQDGVETPFIPYSNEYLDSLEKDYLKMYNDPNTRMDDGFDAFYHSMVDSLPDVTRKAKGWVEYKPGTDIEEFTEDDGSNIAPIPGKNRMVKRVEDYELSDRPDTTQQGKLASYMQKRAINKLDKRTVSNKRYDTDIAKQKNGGWLDNYNDSQASAPEGMVGDGFSNVGRNYSPAWGGQFQEGGEIPNAQKGERVPATRSDSLAVYNSTRAIDDYFKNKGYIKEKVKDTKRYKENEKFAKSWVDETQKILNAAKKQPLIPGLVTLASKNKEIAEARGYLKNAQKSLSKTKDEVNPKNYLQKLKESRELFDTKEKDVGRYVDKQNNLVEGKPSAEEFYAPIDENTFNQREQSQGFLDLRSPMPLYDERITPQYLSIYISPESIKHDELADRLMKTKNEKERAEIEKQLIDIKHQDHVEMYDYDPLAVMPFDILKEHPELIPERIKKYGTEGIPTSVIQQHPEWGVNLPIKNTTQLQPIKDPVTDTTPTISLTDEQVANENGMYDGSVTPREPNKYKYVITEGGDTQTGYITNPEDLDYYKRLQKMYNEGDYRNWMGIKNKVEITPEYDMNYGSWDVTSVRYNMQGPSDRYNYNLKDVDYKKAMQIKAAADAYNADVEKRYGPQNEYRTAKSAAEAAKRLKQLRWEFNMTPSYQMGGNVYPVNYVPQAAMGASIPGSPGFSYARTNDPAPSEGPYAKKTMASAQNGKEMKYYQEGLDWKPKTISKNGGRLDGYEKAQEGSTTKDKPKLGAGKYYTTTGKVVDWGTPEYERAYNRGEVLSEDGVRSEVTLEGGVLPELVLQNNYKNGFWENYRDKIIEEGEGSGVLGATLGVPINAVFSLPQLAMMNAITGKVQRPSQAWGFENNEGWFANPTSFGKHLANLGLDIVTDPASWVGVSELTAPGRLTKAQALERLSNLKNIKAGNLFGKQKGKGPNYRLITDEDLSLSDFNKASKQQIKSIGEKNVYKDIAKSESKRHQDLLRDIEEYGEGWKYLDEDIASSAKRAADAKAEWTNYLDAQEANIKANPEYFNNTADELVYYKGEGLGKQELEQLAKEQVDQWYAIQEYKGTRPNTKGYISDVEDYMGDPKYMLPGNRFNREAMLRDMGEDAMNSFNKLYKNQNWKPNIGDIPLNKQGGVIKSDRGQWDYPGQITEIDQSKEGSYIDMGPDPKTGKPITQNILAVSDTGDVRLMRPGGKYKLEGKKVVEYPIAQTGTKTKGKLNPKLQAALDKFSAEHSFKPQPKSDKIQTREVFTATNDNILNASNEAAKIAEKFDKQQKYEAYVEAKKAQEQRTAQRQFNALPKEEQERVLQEQYAQQYGTITQGDEPDSKLSKFAQSLVFPMTALKDLYHTGEVRDDLIRSVWNNPTATENNALDAVYLGTLGYLAAPFIQSGVTAVGSTVAPYMAADAVVPYTGATLTGVNLNNILTAGFATHGAMHMGPDVAKFADRPSWENLGNIAWDVAEVAPVVGPAAKTIGEGFGYFGKGFGYLGDKGRQAITAVKESTPYVALNKSAETKLIQRLDEIRDARMQLQYGPHNKEVDDALNKLADEEWKIIYKLDKRKPYSTAADQAYINIKSRQIDKANQFTLNNEGLYQSKVDHPLGFKQGSSQIIDLETGEMFPISVKGSGVEAVQKMDDQGNVIKTVTNTSEPIMNEDYIRVLNRNIAYIEKNVPGAKVYGSTRTAGELGVPHVTGEMANGKPFFEVGDYDVYMTQSNYEKHFGKKPGIDYSKPQNHAGPGEHGKDLQMQVNVIAENQNGKATGSRALELFRQWEPDEFFKAAKEAMKKGAKAEIEIPYTSEQLIEKVNPTVKTVMDAYEAYKNEKNINKIDGIINYGNPDIVLEGQKQFVKSLVGSRGNLGHQFDVSQFADVNENLKILKDINFIGNPTRVANDPRRMQIAINDFYINNSILSRQVKDIPLDDLATYESALGTYDPNASGMSFNGIGQNNTTLGDVGHYNPPKGSNLPKQYVTGVKQYGLNLDVSNPRAYIESIKHTTSGSKLFTQEEKDILYEIVQKYKGKIDGYSPERSDTTTQLVHNLPKSEEAKALMYEFAKKTNRRLNIQEGNVYHGGSTYVSALDDFDEAIDLMTYTYGEHYDFDMALKSFQKRLQSSKMTSSQQINALSDELLPREFKQIEGYLKGGMDKAKERVQQLRDELAKLHVQKGDFARRAANRKLGGLRTQIEAKEKAFRDEIRILTDNEREIQKRLDQVAKFKSHSKMVAKNFLIGSSVAGTGVVGGKLATLKFDQVRDSAKEEETKLKEKFKKLTPDQQNEAQSDYEMELIRLQQIQKSPFNSGILGSTVRETNNPLLKVDQNGGRINRAIDRTQLVKLNQLTNFTNYNKPQPGGWLSKYE